ncbi:hypothetical protein CEUSTIGMA_g7918.t1, partial [Chlamydomonas eustigma]
MTLHAVPSGTTMTLHAVPSGTTMTLHAVPSGTTMTLHAVPSGTTMTLHAVPSGTTVTLHAVPSGTTMTLHAVPSGTTMTLHAVPSGTTVTLALVTGSLITVANLGDSEAVLDTGCSIIEMTQSHRFQDNSSECQRMRSLGSKVASLGLHLQGPAEPGERGVGPLRCWPGGLCVGRGIGDGDAGPGVLPLPHIKQVLVPEQGCRVILASDGLWDSVSLSKAVRMVRGMDSSEAAQQLVRHIMYTRFTDDTSVLILDMLPVGTPSFSHVSSLMVPYTVKAEPKAAGLFACLLQPKEKQEPNAELIEGPAHLRLLISIDMLKTRAG